MKSFNPFTHTQKVFKFIFAYRFDDQKSKNDNCQDRNGHGNDDRGHAT